MATSSTQDGKQDPVGMRTSTGYMPIEGYGLIGNMHTAALVATDGGLDFMCWPSFDSPSIFCRMLDAEKGGFFTVNPASNSKVTTKQSYLPNSNILQTMFLEDAGVLNLLDFMPRPRKADPLAPLSCEQSLSKWLVRRVECVRGEVNVCVKVLPAFNYARDRHSMEILSKDRDGKAGKCSQYVVFKSKDVVLELRATFDGVDEENATPQVLFERTAGTDLGEAVVIHLHLREGQHVSFVLRDHLSDSDHQKAVGSECITTAHVDRVQRDTKHFWSEWISQSRYTGRWQEVVQRSLLTLKLLIFEPTGAILAAPSKPIPAIRNSTSHV